MNKAVRDYLAENGRKGGESKSKAKREAVRKNLEKARKKRWIRKGVDKT